VLAFWNFGVAHGAHYSGLGGGCKLLSFHRRVVTIGSFSKKLQQKSMDPKLADPSRAAISP